MTCKRLALLLTALVTVASARSGGMLPRMRGDEFRTRLDSLQRLPPNLRYYEMTRDPMFKDALKPMPDSGISMIGKWGRGPSVKVTGRDSLVFLSLGSEVAIINMANPATPRVISEVQARSVVARSVLKDSFLIIGGQGIEIWNVADPANPVHRADVPVTVSDICVLDSLLLTISGDSFRVFNVALVSNPRPMGASHDTGTSVTASGHTAYIAIYDRTAPLGVIDLQNPANPRLVGLWGQYVLAPSAIDSFCYVTNYDPQNPGWFRFTVLDVANPLSIVERGHLDNAGGYDIYPLEWFAYVAGPSPSTSAGVFRIVDVSDPDWPTMVSSCATPTASNGVWVDNPFGHAQVADWSEGLDVIDINDPVNPVLDTSLLQADAARDIVVQLGLALVADGQAGLRLLDVSDPILPTEIGAYDSTWYATVFEAVTASDSFAFTGGWGNAPMRSVDISNPANPVFAALAPGSNWNVEAIKIRGTSAYLACDNRFQIYDISNPRAMRLVGSCGLSLYGNASGLALKDTFAYVTGYPALTIVNVARSANPTVIDSFVPEDGDGALGVAVLDSLVLLASDSIRVINVANPRSPFQVCDFPGVYFTDDIILVGSYAYTNCYTASQLVVFDVTDPTNATRVAQCWAPGVNNLFFDGRCVYAACADAGVCIFDTVLSTGIAGPRSQLVFPISSPIIWFEPNPTGGAGALHFSGLLSPSPFVAVHDATGRLVKSRRLSKTEQLGRVSLSFAGLPSGIYFVALDGKHAKLTTKVVKR